MERRVGSRSNRNGDIPKVPFGDFSPADGSSVCLVANVSEAASGRHRGMSPACRRVEAGTRR